MDAGGTYKQFMLKITYTLKHQPEKPQEMIVHDLEVTTVAFIYVIMLMTLKLVLENDVAFHIS